MSRTSSTRTTSDRNERSTSRSTSKVPTLDAETRALSKSPAFQALIAAGRASKAKGGISADELARRHGITDAERAAVRARIIEQARAEGEVAGPPSANGLPAEAPAREPARSKAVSR